MKASPTLDIVIVNWNAGALLRDCLQSIADTHTSAFTLSRVVLVDNASTDGSIPSPGLFGLPLELMLKSTNAGFAAACNEGAKDSTAEFLLFLNPDTRLFPETLDHAIAFLGRSSSSGIGVCGVANVGDDGTVMRTCARFPGVGNFLNAMTGMDRLMPRSFPGVKLREWDHASNRLVDHVIGAFYLIRASLFKELGGFDERFFVYLEDLDLSLRVATAGWTIQFLGDARIHHKGGGTTDTVRGVRLYHALRSRIRYSQKNLSRSSAAVIVAVTLTLELVARLLDGVIRLSPAKVRATLQAYRLLCNDLFLGRKDPRIQAAPPRT